MTWKDNDLVVGHIYPTLPGKRWHAVQYKGIDHFHGRATHEFVGIGTNETVYCRVAGGRGASLDDLLAPPDRDIRDQMTLASIAAMSQAEALLKQGRDLMNEQAAIIDSQTTRIKALEAALQECAEYFDNKADADCDQDGFIPNREMQLLSEIKTLIGGDEAGRAAR